VYRYIGGKVATELILVGLGYPLRSYPRINDVLIESHQSATMELKQILLLTSNIWLRFSMQASDPNVPT
jgi:hypothetical protein